MGIEIQKEGFVAVANNKIPLKNYLFYLNYNDRAQALNKMVGNDISQKNIYKAAKDYRQKFNSETSKINATEKGEIVMSLSPQLCAKAISYKFNNKMSSFKKDFALNCDRILTNNLEQQEFTIFIHEYDSSKMRVHAHVIFYPYTAPVEKLNLKNLQDQEIVVKIPKVWIEKPKLAAIKKQFNQYARSLNSGLEAKPDVAVSQVDKYSNDELFEAIPKLGLKPQHNNNNLLPELWSSSEIKALSKIISVLRKTSDDKKITTKQDFSIVVDYLHTFTDKEIYNLFFNHSAIKSIVRSFSLYKSAPKFSAVLLKLLHLTTDEEILSIIKKKLNGKKAGDLSNVLKIELLESPEIHSKSISPEQTQSLYPTPQI